MCYNKHAMMDPRLVLASHSPRRRELLQLLERPFDIVAADVDESPQRHETAVQLAIRLSETKARCADIDDRRKAVVVACDTVVALDKAAGEPRILGKPRDTGEATEMLRSLRGQSHVVHSAVTTLGPTGQATTQLVSTRLTMRRYTERELAEYVATGDPLDKAGAYAIQHRGFHPVETIDGCYANVMGLPLCHLALSLRHLGCPPATNVPTGCQAYTGHTCTLWQETIEP